MTKTYKTYLPEQDLLLPPSLRDWLPENHLAYCVSDVVDELDLSAIESVYEEEDRGQPPYHPRMMTRFWCMAIAWECFPLAGFRSVWRKTWLSGCWPPAISRISALYRIFENFI